MPFGLEDVEDLRKVLEKLSLKLDLRLPITLPSSSSCFPLHPTATPPRLFENDSRILDDNDPRSLPPLEFLPNLAKDFTSSPKLASDSDSEALTSGELWEGVCE